MLALGAGRLRSLWTVAVEARLPLLAAAMAGFGAVISEVGAALMVGGNIAGQTRVLTTAAVLEASKGAFALALALGLILLVLAFAVNLVLTAVQQRGARDRRALAAGTRDVAVSPAVARSSASSSSRSRRARRSRPRRERGGQVHAAAVAGGLRSPTRGRAAPRRPPGDRAADPRGDRRRAAAPAAATRATARANVETGLRFSARAARGRRRRRDEWLERLGLAGLADRSARRAVRRRGAAGQHRSRARARAGVLLLDEPFGALDAPTRAELLVDLRDVLASIGAAPLLVTHDRHEAAADRRPRRDPARGELRQLGPAAAVLDNPADADCARLLGFENLLEPALASRLLGEPADDPVAVRARDVAVIPGGDMGVVERVLPFGERTRISTRVDGVRVLSDVRDPPVAAGASVDLRVAASAARVIARG